MARTILEVDAFVVDANGTFNHMSGYPKRFDSKNYNDDLEGTMRRARAEYFTTLGTLYGSQSNRQIQTVMLYNVKGRIVLSESIGDFPAPEPEPEPNTEPAEE